MPNRRPMQLSSAVMTSKPVVIETDKDARGLETGIHAPLELRINPDVTPTSRWTGHGTLNLTNLTVSDIERARYWARLRAASNSRHRDRARVAAVSIIPARGNFRRSTILTLNPLPTARRFHNSFPKPKHRSDELEWPFR
jgi:hypothetical protein